MEKANGDEQDKEQARQAVQKAQNNPATVEDVRNSTTADLNNDGFVTLDEVVAMERAGLSDDEMIKRLEATNQIFELSADQQKYLRDRGVSQHVIDRMQQINADKREQILGDQNNNQTKGSEVISQ